MLFVTDDLNDSDVTSYFLRYKKAVVMPRCSLQAGSSPAL